MRKKREAKIYVVGDAHECPFQIFGAFFFSIEILSSGFIKDDSR